MKTAKTNANHSSPWTSSTRVRVEGTKSSTVLKTTKGDRAHSCDSISSLGSASSKPRSKSSRSQSATLQSAKEEIRRITNKENRIRGSSRATSSATRVTGRIGTSLVSRSVTVASVTTPLLLRKRMEGAGVNRGGVSAMDGGGAGDTVIAELQKSKRALEQQVSELVHNAEGKKAEIAQLKMELNKLKEQHHTPDEPVMQEQIDTLLDENQSLKERLVALGGSLQSALSDTEKELLLQSKCNSAPPSIIGLTQDGSHPRPPLATSKSDCGCELDLGEASGTIYPPLSSDWDKQSSSSLSEMSVACLQDRILQMEETHYSTNEELQATLCELSDLQAEIERLAEEKAVLLESLCSQTEKLEDCRGQNDNLRQLLLDDQKTGPDREVKLLELLKSSQEEKESLVAQLNDLRMDVDNAHEDGSRTQEDLTNVQERVVLLQSFVDGANADKRVLEKQLAESKEYLGNAQIEITRMRTQLDNERIKVSELQQAREAADKSELDEMLDNAHKEKDRVEAQVAMLSEQLAVSQCEASRVKESLGILQEEMMVAKNNAKKQISDLEYRIEQLNGEIERTRNERVALQDDVSELERKCQRHLEDKRDLRAAISELKHKVREATEKAESAEKMLTEARDTYETEMRDWKQFQDDLLMTVRVANDFKTEAQQELERLVIENKQLKEKVSALQAELDKVKVVSEPAPADTSPRRVLRTVSSIENPVLCSMEQEMVCLRRSSRQDNRPLSVKSLIESIECAAKQAKAQNGSSGSSSTSSIDSVVSEKSPSSATGPRKSESDVYIKPPLRPSNSDSSSTMHDDAIDGSTTTTTTTSPFTSFTEVNKSSTVSDRVSMSPGNKVTTETDAPKTISSPISILSNKLEPMRRNSYSDILDKKDPLVSLVKGGGSRRNALLKWCQNKTIGYKGIDITNFSSSWNDGLAFCAILHSYLPEKIPYDELDNKDKRRNFTLAFKAADSVGIPCNLNISDMISMERPDWQAVMAYITAIYKHFET